MAAKAPPPPSAGHSNVYFKVKEAISQRLMFHVREGNVQRYQEQLLASRLTDSFTQCYATETTFTDKMFDALVPFVDTEIQKLNTGPQFWHVQ